ncbi:hypothetical protein KIL84_019973 [Mauremys mutica]|uniref:Uncharacterized protein n=1 Tax=Mauremys mutica TaxID=74926 RepID=A0A9D3XT91_9SAUR|nr:hypothetical protein KIL84_019973 [Mauremys mutica]
MEKINYVLILTMNQKASQAAFQAFPTVIAVRGRGGTVMLFCLKGILVCFSLTLSFYLFIYSSSVMGCTHPSLNKEGAKEAIFPCPCWACSNWRSTIKGSSSAQSGLTIEKGGHTLPAPAWELLKPQIVEAKPARSGLLPSYLKTPKGGQSY